MFSSLRRGKPLFLLHVAEIWNNQAKNCTEDEHAIIWVLTQTTLTAKRFLLANNRLLLNVKHLYASPTKIVFLFVSQFSECSQGFKNFLSSFCVNSTFYSIWR